MISVVGGVYGEKCFIPNWDFVYGSGGRAAACLSNRTTVELHTILSPTLKDDFDHILRGNDFLLRPVMHEHTVVFKYAHPLTLTHLEVSGDSPPTGTLPIVRSTNILVFGMIDYLPTVHGGKVVFDPQGEGKTFEATGSTADQLVYVLNVTELAALTGVSDVEKALDKLLEVSTAYAIVVKRGPLGATVRVRGEQSISISAYRSKSVLKIGSGDVFSAAFGYYWMERNMPIPEAADLASKAVATYVETRDLIIPEDIELNQRPFYPIGKPKGRIYIAAPFFSVEQLWLVEETKRLIELLGGQVFSPLHDVGLGKHEVAGPDLAGLEECVAVLAIINDRDPGTVFEIGYAIAKGIPVIVLAERNLISDLTMLLGTDCAVYSDYSSALYAALWRSCD